MSRASILLAWIVPAFFAEWPQVGIDRFEDVHSWQEARKLIRLIYGLAKKPGFKSDYKLRNQSRAAAVSCMGNIAEAHGRFSFEEKRQFHQEAYDCAEMVGKLVKGSIDNLKKQINLRRQDRGRGWQSPT